jgi:hypothetical protein
MGLNCLIVLNSGREGRLLRLPGCVGSVLEPDRVGVIRGRVARLGGRGEGGIVGLWVRWAVILGRRGSDNSAIRCLVYG